MRIGRKTAAGLQLPPEILQLLRAQPALHKRARIKSRCRVPLEINRVPFEILRPSAEEMVEAHLIQRRCRSVSRDVPADIVDRKSTRLNSSHPSISYAVFCLK